MKERDCEVRIAAIENRLKMVETHLWDHRFRDKVIPPAIPFQPDQPPSDIFQAMALLRQLPAWPWKKREKDFYIKWSTEFLTKQYQLASAGPEPQPPCTNEFVADGCERFGGA